jgi:PDZ domain-containing secreted protein
VRNDAKSTLVLKAGEQQYSIEPGKTAQMKLAEGAELINVNGTEKQAAGSVLTTVSKQLQGNTLAVS